MFIVYIDLAADQEKDDQLEAKIKELADVESCNIPFQKDEEVEDVTKRALLKNFHYLKMMGTPS